VVTLDGEGKDGVTIAMTRFDVLGEARSPIFATTSGGGTYSMEVVAGFEWEVGVRIPPQGATCSGSKRVNVVGGGTTQVNFTCATTPATFHGVVTVDGTGWPDATVTIRNLETGEEYTAATNGDGHYQTSVFPGNYTASVDLSPIECEASKSETQAEAGGEGSIDFTCTIPWGRVEGQVLLDGEPAAGQKVTLRNSAFEVVNRVTTDGEGRYSQEFFPGTVLVSVEIEGAVCPLSRQGEVPARGVLQADMECLSIARDYNLTLTETGTTCGTPLQDPFTVLMKVVRAADPEGVQFDLFLGDRDEATKIRVVQDPETGVIAGVGPQFDDGTGVLIQETVELAAEFVSENPLLLGLEGSWVVTGTGDGGASCSKTYGASAVSTEG
jgi:hypothetical protein